MNRYVWSDDIQRREVVRVDLRIPRPLHAFLAEVATVNSVSMNALVVGIVAHACDAQRHRRLRVEVSPAVRVTELTPASDPVTIPVPEPSRATRRRYNLPKVR